MAFLTGIFASMGLGGGMVLIVYLTVFAGFSQLAAQGINLVFFIPIAIISLVLHTKNKLVEWKKAVPAVLWGTAAVIISAACKQDRAKPAFKSFRYFPYPNGTERVIFQE